MPRRNHRSRPRRRTRPDAIAVPQPSTETLARALVNRGVCSPLILDYPNRRTTPEGNPA